MNRFTVLESQNCLSTSGDRQAARLGVRHLAFAWRRKKTATERDDSLSLCVENARGRVHVTLGTGIKPTEAERRAKLRTCHFLFIFHLPGLTAGEQTATGATQHKHHPMQPSSLQT